MAVGFDSRDFKRTKVIESRKAIQFYSPLGIGVKTNDVDKLRNDLSD